MALTSVMQPITKEESGELSLDDKLRIAQRMESLGVIACGLTHDFNNALAVMIGYSELIRTDLAIQPDDDRIERILTAGKRAAQLASHLMRIGHGIDRADKPLIIAPVLKEAVKLLSSSFTRKCEFVLEIADDMVSSYFSPVSLHQVAFNLCINAVEASDKNNLIEIKLDSACLTPPNSSRKADFAILSIKDHGHGIRPEHREEIFKPFYTTKESGNGLGLHMVKSIVESSGGWIDLHSVVKKGSTFRVFIPATSVNRMSEESEKDQPITGGGESIAIYDSTPDLASIYRKLCIAGGYRAESFTGIIQLFEYLEKHAHGVDVVVLDDTVKGDSLGEVLSHIHILNPDLPVILMTASRIDERTDAFVRRGLVTTCVNKPLTSQQLMSRINGVVRMFR